MQHSFNSCHEADVGPASLALSWLVQACMLKLRLPTLHLSRYLQSLGVSQRFQGPSWTNGTRSCLFLMAIVHQWTSNARPCQVAGNTMCLQGCPGKSIPRKMMCASSLPNIIGCRGLFASCGAQAALASFQGLIQCGHARHVKLQLDYCAIVAAVRRLAAVKPLLTFRFCLQQGCSLSFTHGLGLWLCPPGPYVA